MIRILPFVLFFISGWCSLVYEIVWSRMLVLVLGNTTLSATTILAAFMLGLSFGSIYWGRWIETHPNRPLFTFGCLEFGVGLFAVISCYLIKLVLPLETILFSPDASTNVISSGIRFLLCVMLLFAPTFLMGGTLAVLVKQIVSSRLLFDRGVSLLYGINTLGAVLGAMCAGFFMIEHLGHKNAVFMASILNFGIAAIVLITNRPSKPITEAIKETLPNPSLSEVIQENPRSIFTCILTALFISGFCAMAYQVLWTRLLILIIDNSIYSLTIIIVGFLIGIALGGLFCLPAFRIFPNYLRMFALIQMGIGITAWVLPFFIAYETKEGGESYARFLISTLPLWMLVPTTLMGMVLPIGASIFQHLKKNVGSSLGIAYGANTFGAVAGAWAGSFFLITRFGFRGSFLLLSTANMVVAGVFLFLSLKKQYQTIISMGGIGLAVSLLVIYGSLQMPHGYFSNKYSALEPDSAILYYNESVSTTATIFQRPGRQRSLYLNGIAEVDTSLLSMRTFRFMGALPGLLHPQPENALIVTFGAGITSGTAAYFVQKLDCVDLSSQANLIEPYFKNENEDIVNNPKFSIYIDDARHFLQNTKNTYSFIVSDATHPRVYDSWVLYTDEFYDLVKARLKKDGIFLQWLPLHGLETATYKTIIRTFQTAFPHTSIFSVNGGYSILLATPDRLAIDFGRIVKQLIRQDLRKHLKTVGLENPFKLLSCFVMAEDTVKTMVKDETTRMTDDSPGHLFFPFRSTFEEQYQKWPQDNFKMLMEHSESVVPYLVNLGADSHKAGKIREIMRYYEYRGNR